MDPNSRAAKLALMGRKKLGRDEHEKKQRRIDKLAEDREEVGGSSFHNDSFQSTSSRNSNMSAKVNVSINQNQDGRNILET